MKKYLLSWMLMLSSIPAFANSQFETYTIIYGGGVDDLGLGLKDQ